MKRLFVCALCFVSVVSLIFTIATSTAGAENTLTADEQAEGWLLLFDGESLFGWRAAGTADFRVENGTIVVDSGEVCLLRTTSQFDDYVLKVDFRVAAETNSGIFLRTSPQPRDAGLDCYELNIAPANNPFPTGSFVRRAQVSGQQPAPDEWHTFEVRAEAGHFTVDLDGQRVLDYHDPKWLGRGYIGLQHNSGRAEFRNVKLLPLGLAPIFNGKDLSGWRQPADNPSQFSVTDQGELHVTNGRGYLESEASYGDFLLQIDAISHAPELNSGVFFRCIPGEEMNGYESQIHNGFLNGDRTQPKDCGTGGIFRRVNARRVVADDGQWLHKTIVATGPHIAVWVNGWQVTDWTDTRKPDANPRRGTRIEAGSLMLQGHDETTDFSFRNIRVREQHARWSEAGANGGGS